MIIKLILVSSIIFMLYRLLSARRNVKTQASKKIFLMLLMILAIITVLKPEISNWAAEKVGVGRGADLLLYVICIAFFFQIINNYIKSKEERRVFVRVVRKQSIMDAVIRYKMY